MKVVVVIPTHSCEHSNDEELSLNVRSRVLSRYPAVFAVPSSLDTTSIETRWRPFSIERFPDSWFAGPRAYNRLLLCPDFYERFGAYDYMLIYQTDCLVFEDSLLDWCGKKYDYIGAPWFAGRNENTDNVLLGVGNGGLSLRRIRTALHVLHQHDFYPSFDRIAALTGQHRIFYLAAMAILCRLGRRRIRMPYRDLFLWLYAWQRIPSEDIFWSGYASFFINAFRIPDVWTALKFAFELKPRKCLELNGGQLPFGCHAWWRYDRAFWMNVLREKNLLT